MKKLKYLILFALSCATQLVLAQGVVNVGSGGGVADSTRLVQDSILVYYQGGVEIGRDTISVTGTTTQPAGSNGQIQFNASGAFGASSLLTYSTADSSLAVNGIKIWKGRWGKSANTAVGESTLTAVTTGTGNTAIGSNALRDNTTGSQNTATGQQALFSNGGGNYNVANGYQALFYNTTGYRNTAHGHGALYYNTTGYRNTATGVGALYSNTIGNFNTANGEYALYSNTTGIQNIANGVNALYSNTIGTGNTAIGVQALYSNTSGFYNTANGYQALYYNTTGNQNTAFGYRAGRYITGSSENTSANNSVFVGAATKAAAINQTNQIVIGHGATGLGDSTAVLGTAMKKVRLGDNLTFKTDQTIGAGQDNYVLTYDHSAGSVSLEAAASGADGNGIYSGDGTAPADVDVTVTDSINFDAGTLFINGVNNRIGIGTVSPQRTLQVTGEVRITDLTTDTPTRIVGADADGDLGAITKGTGLQFSNDTLNARGAYYKWVEVTSATYTITDEDLILVNCTSNNITLTLPTGAADGKQIIVKRIDTTGGRQVDWVGTLEGSVDPTNTLTTATFPAYTIVKTGSSWLIISEKP